MCAYELQLLAFLLLLLVCYRPLARRARQKIDSQPCAAKLHRLRKIIMSTVKVSTTFGHITLKLRPDAAPKTVEHLPVHKSIVAARLRHC